MNQLILVVEDDATMQKMALKILRSRGFSCELARSGREAVAMAAALKPALILMDLSLPEMRSEEHTSELQSRLHLVCRLLLEKKKKNKYEAIFLVICSTAYAHTCNHARAD